MREDRHMKTKMRAKQMKAKIIIATAIIGVTALAGVVYAAEQERENEQKIALTDMPAAVQKTIQDNLGGGTITETAKETKEGKTVYQAHIKKSGGEEVEIKVAENGKLLDVGKDDDQLSKDYYPCLLARAQRNSGSAGSRFASLIDSSADATNES